MNALLHDLILQSAEKSPDNVAIVHRGTVIRYAELAEQIHAVAHGLQQQGLANAAHIATYLPKQAEAVSTLFGASLAGAVFVPINPLLKARQVGHILTDAKVRALVTTQERAHQLTHVLGTSKDLETLILVGKSDPAPLDIPGVNVLPWNELILASRPAPPSPPSSAREGDLAAILYTSGSSGQPKGVMLSHRNLVLGAQSVVDYLHNTADDRLLAVLPLSFDYGLSQLTTAFCVGASVVLMEYLMPRDVIRAVATHRITGLAGVPTLWTQIAHLPWPDDARRSLRYLTNSGGAMPRHT
ncbi:MAG TPA: acyl-CoA ligase (AMP-forming), exosortase A system-associated, partial [Gammaproteobacteria bacterium]|nr:acyl-CoA ligase (AMP-forming), exosortase A system-associated [Gammaproteobacteria bacterium]